MLYKNRDEVFADFNSLKRLPNKVMLFLTVGAGKTELSIWMSKKYENTAVLVIAPKGLHSMWKSKFEEQGITNYALSYDSLKSSCLGLSNTGFSKTDTYEKWIYLYLEHIKQISKKDKILLIFDECHKLKSLDSQTRLRAKKLISVCNYSFFLTGTPKGNITSKEHKGFEYLNLLRLGYDKEDFKANMGKNLSEKYSFLNPYKHINDSIKKDKNLFTRTGVKEDYYDIYYKDSIYMEKDSEKSSVENWLLHSESKPFKLVINPHIKRYPNQKETLEHYMIKQETNTGAKIIDIFEKGIKIYKISQESADHFEIKGKSGYDSYEIIKKEVPIKNFNLINISQNQKALFEELNSIHLEGKIEEIKKIIAENKEKKIIIWCNYIKEYNIILETFKGCTPDFIEDFKNGKNNILVASMLKHAEGNNWQYAHINIFNSPCVVATSFTQAIARTLRHGQTDDVKAYILYYSLEKFSVEAMLGKWHSNR